MQERQEHIERPSLNDKTKEITHDKTKRLQLRLEQILRETSWQTSSHLKHKVMIEEFEVSGALIITIAVTNTKSCSTLEKQTLNLTVTA